MSPSWMRCHLSLLSKRGGAEFGTGADGRHLDGFCVGMELMRVVDICLFVLRRRGESKVTGSAEGTKSSMEVDRGGLFKSDELFKEAQDRLKAISKGRKMGDCSGERGRGGAGDGVEVEEGKKVVTEERTSGGDVGDN